MAIIFKKGIDQGLYKNLDQEDLARFKVPTNACWHYPLVKFDPEDFVPSDIYMLDDPFMNGTLFKVINAFLLKDHQDVS